MSGLDRLRKIRSGELTLGDKTSSTTQKQSTTPKASGSTGAERLQAIRNSSTASKDTAPKSSKSTRTQTTEARQEKFSQKRTERSALSASRGTTLTTEGRKKVEDGWAKAKERAKKSDTQKTETTVKTGKIGGGHTQLTGDRAGTVKGQGFMGRKMSTGEVLKEAVNSGVDQAGLGIAQTVAFAEGLVTRPIDYLISGGQDTSLTDNAMFHKIRDSIAESVEDRERKLAPNLRASGKAKEKVYQYGGATVAAIPNALLAMTTAGGSEAANVGLKAASSLPGIAGTLKTAASSMVKNPMFWSSYFQTVGGEYEEAKARGASEAAATLEALAATTIIAAVEVGGGIETLPTELQGGKFTVRKWIEAMIDEGKEEVVQGIVSRAFQNVVAKDKAPTFSTQDENAVFNPVTAAEEFAGGAVVGGILGGAQGVANNILSGAYSSQVETEKAIDRAQSAPYNETIKTPEVTVENRGTSLYAQLGMKLSRAEYKAAIVEKLVSGQKVTNGELKALNLSDAKYQAIFAQLTGVDVSQARSEEGRFALARTAKDAQTQTNAQTQVNTQVQPNAQEQAAENRLSAPASLEQFTQALQGARGGQLDAETIQQEYDRYVRDMDLLGAQGAESMTRMEFRQMMRETAPAAANLTDAQLDDFFDAIRSGEVRMDQTEGAIDNGRAADQLDGTPGEGVYVQAEGGHRGTETARFDGRGNLSNDRADRGVNDGRAANQLAGTSGEGVYGHEQDLHRSDAQKRTLGRGDLSNVRAGRGVNDEQGDLRDPGVVRLSNTEADRETFSAALTAARDNNEKNGWAVTPKSAADLEGSTLLTMNQNSAGLAVTESGDIEAVFRNPKTGAKGSLNTLMPQAIENGGRKLDCYGEGLVYFYEKYGFKPVSKVEFNPEYANPGWNGVSTPDIYFMVATDTDADSVREKIGTYPHATKAELDALPSFGKDGYDEAYSYRDGLLEKGAGNDGRTSENHQAGQKQSSDPGTERQSESLRRFYDEAESRGQTARLFSPAGDKDAGRGRLGRFTEVTGEARSEVARRAQKELSALGLESFVHNGDLEVLTASGKIMSGGDAAVVNHGIVGISNQADLAPKELAGHEAYHFWAGRDARGQFTDTVMDSINWTSQEFRNLYEHINDSYFDGEYDMDNESQRRKFNEELVAYISGSIHNGEDMGELLADQNGVRAAWENLVQENQKNSKGATETAEAGLGAPSSYAEQTPEQQSFTDRYDAAYGKGAAQAMAETARQVFRQAQQQAAEHPVTAQDVGSIAQADDGLMGWMLYGRTQESAVPKPLGKESVGAADKGFDPYSYLQNEYGTIPQTGKDNARIVDVPASTNGEDKVHKTVSTVMGAAATPESRLTDIASAVVDGKLSYIPTENRIGVNKARAAIRKNGYAATLDNWSRAVQEGRVNSDLVAMGATLLNNAGNGEMSGARYVDLMSDYATLLKNAGQALQAAQIYKKMSPEAKLYEVGRVVQRINDDISQRKPSRRQRKQMEKEAKAQKNGTGESKSSGRKGRTYAKDYNLTVDFWMDRVGEILADKLVERTKTKATKEQVRTVVDTVLDDLYQRAAQMVDTAPAGEKAKQRTEMERIQDMFDNYDHYKEAWESAKDTIRRTLGDNAEVNEALDGWMKSDLELARPLTEELTGQNEVVMDSALAEEYLRAETDEERDKVLDRILQNIADQIPSTWSDKLTAWRYTAMLGNLRTQFRNILGNSAMQVTRALKDINAGLAEVLLQKAGVIQERTNSVFWDTDTRASAEGEFEAVRDVIMSGGKYRNQPKSGKIDYMDKIEGKRRVFQNQWAEKWRTATNKAMDAGDEFFCKHTFYASLARYMAANHTTWAEASEDMKQKARLKAIQEAAEATYRDTNSFSEIISQFRVKDPNKSLGHQIAHQVVEGVMPFRKTPANVLVRSVEYSPLGLIQTAYLTAQKASGNGEVTGNDIINSAAKNLTGVGLIALGAGLASFGYLKGSGPDDDKEKELWEQQGHQEYSLEIGGHSYTLDWAAPTTVPVFLGANLADAFLKEGATVEDMTSALAKIGDPLLQMSMLQGINQTLEEAARNGDSAVVMLVTNAIYSYFTQYIPTLLGQTKRSLNNTRMTTYADKGNNIPDNLEYALGKLTNKLPTPGYSQITYIDNWGRTQQNAGDVGLVSGSWINFVNQLAGVGYTSQVHETGMEEELVRLHQATGVSGVLINSAPKVLTVNQQARNLTSDEYLNYAVTRGQTAFQLMTDLTSSKLYAGLSDKQKVTAVKAGYDYANQIAQARLFGKEYTTDNWVREAQALEEEHGISVSTYLAAEAVTKDITGIKTGKKNKSGSEMTATNSKALKEMDALYKLPGLTEDQVKLIAEAMGIGESVRGYSPKLIKRKLEILNRKYGPKK